MNAINLSYSEDYTVPMSSNDLKAILSHLRNARNALEGGATGVVMAAIKISDNIICKRLFGEVIYPEMSDK